MGFADPIHKEMNFWRKYIFSLDHKVIGIQYLLTSFAVGIAGGILAMMIRLNCAWPAHPWPWLAKIFPHGFDSNVMTPEFYASLFTMHGTLMVFFFLSAALVAGFGNYLIPLQIGARDMAFPVLNMLSYWTYVMSVFIMFLSFFVPGGASASGWTAYPPLSALKESIPGSQVGQSLWLIGMAFFIASFTMGGLNFVTTVLQLRTRGMAFLRLPMTTWCLFITSIIGILAFPPLTAGAIMLLMDRHFGTSFFLPSGLYVAGKALANHGGTPLLWEHLFWFLGHPEVYILLLPTLGFISDIIPVFSEKPLLNYKLIVSLLVIIAGLSFIVWGHHMYASGMNPYLGTFFLIPTTLISFPFGITVLSLIATLRGARIRYSVPFLFSVATIFLMVSGGLTGLFLASPAADIQLHDTYFVVGHFHLIMASAALFGVFCGTYYWFPKMFGRMLNEKLGKIHFWITFISFYTTFFPMYFLGIHGMMRRLYDASQYDYLKPLQPLSVFITLSAFVLAAAQLVFIFNFTLSLLKGEKALSNPWGASTLEWQTSSPPPHGNWDGPLPEVHGGLF